jgi:hypothetical protein
MTQVGAGWQYRVYDAGEGRVVKIYQNNFDRFLKTFFSRDSGERYQLKSSLRKVRELNLWSRDAITKLKNNLALIPPQLLGNPVFRGEVNYEQDVVTPLGRYIDTHSLEENKKIIQGYARMILELWKYGLSDGYYNFTVNSGVDKEGRVIQADLGDFIFEREEIECHISWKMWITGSDSYSNMNEGKLKEFYKDEMNRLVTLENLDKNWKSAIQSLRQQKTAVNRFLNLSHC